VAVEMIHRLFIYLQNGIGKNIDGDVFSLVCYQKVLLVAIVDNINPK
jgi:hypothetical protein